MILKKKKNETLKIHEKNLKTSVSSCAVLVCMFDSYCCTLQPVFVFCQDRVLNVIVFSLGFLETFYCRPAKCPYFVRISFNLNKKKSNQNKTKKQQYPLTIRNKNGFDSIGTIATSLYLNPVRNHFTLKKSYGSMTQMLMIGLLRRTRPDAKCTFSLHLFKLMFDFAVKAWQELCIFS